MNCPTCNTDVREHPASPCLDAWFAEIVMKWEMWQLSNQTTKWWIIPPEKLIIRVVHFKPSTNIAYAMEGVEKVRNEKGIYLELRIYPDGVQFPPYQVYWFNYPNTKYSDDYLGNATGETLELTITRALIMRSGKGGGDDQEKS